MTERLRQRRGHKKKLHQHKSVKKLSNTGKRNTILNNFTVIDKTKEDYRVCRIIIPYRTASTTNLYRYLRERSPKLKEESRSAPQRLWSYSTITSDSPVVLWKWIKRKILWRTCSSEVNLLMLVFFYDIPCNISFYLGQQN